MRHLEIVGAFGLEVVWFHSHSIRLFYAHHFLFYKVVAAGWAGRLNTNKQEKKEINYLIIC